MKTKPTEFDIASMLSEAKTLNKPFRTPKGPKKFSVYVKNEKGNIVKVNFGDPNMEIKRDDPERRKNFRARHNCANPGPKTKARYWSCKMWSKKSVTEMTKGSHPGYDWDGHTIFDLNDLLKDNPSLAYAEDCDDCGCDCAAAICECDCSCDCDCNKIEAKIEKIGGAKASHEEGSMIKAQIAKSMMQLRELFEMISQMADTTDFEPWVQSKFTKVADYVNSVHSYMKYYEMDMDKTEAKTKAELKDQYASLWENIKKKRDRIKSGSGEKMRKKGDKGAPTPEQMKKAKSKYGEKQEVVVKKSLPPKK